MINSPYSKPEYFFGVVEDRDDPMMLGRVRVRVIGLHPFEKVQGDFTGLATEELPWMQVIQSPQSPSIGGIGQAPVGPLPGTHVVGLFLDKWKINGLVMGTYYGDQVDFGTEGDGFRDGTGTYPTTKGNGTPASAQGGVVGASSTSVVLQTNTGGYGVNPKVAQSPNSGKEDNNPNYDLATMLKGDEGLRLGYYRDSLGYPTIGIGHLIIKDSEATDKKINSVLSTHVGRTITNGKITMEEAVMLFNRDIKITRAAILADGRVGPVWLKMNASRKMAIENMSFQMGVGKLATFKTTLGLLLAEEYDEAYIQARKSLWARQTPGRANRVTMVLKTGNLESYGVAISDNKGRSVDLLTSSFSGTKEDGGNIWDEFLPKPTIPGIDLELLEKAPETEYVEPDSKVMFVEPDSAYQGEYPYVQATETEGGHRTEYDNTPGKERYKYQHPSGTYTEIAGDGQTVNRIIGDSYRIYKASDHLLIESDSKVVINGNAKVYILGKNDSVIDGDNNETVNGNITLIGSQNLDLTLEGNSTVNIKGNANVHVEGNGIATYDGDYDMTVNGNMTTTVNGERIDNVSGSWGRKTTGEVRDVADGTYTLDGTRIDVGL